MRMKSGQLGSQLSRTQNGSEVLFRILSLGIIMTNLKSLRKSPTEKEHLLCRSNHPKHLLLSARSQDSRKACTGITGCHCIHICQVRVLIFHGVGMFTCIRYQLSPGQVLPFRTLFSGLHIPQTSCLWSMNSCGTACSGHLPTRRRVFVVLIISTAIFLAVTVDSIRLFKIYGPTTPSRFRRLAHLKESGSYLLFNSQEPAQIQWPPNSNRNCGHQDVIAPTIILRGKLLWQWYKLNLRRTYCKLHSKLPSPTP